MGWRIGRGVSDITGEPWGAGMMGYGMPQQRTNGILSRQFARAFVFDDGVDGAPRLVFVVADIGMFFQAGVDAIHRRLAERFGETYGAHNVVLTATHTHCGPGGHGHDILYNITTTGFHGRTFDRLVDGVVEAIVRADADLAPTTATLHRGTLTGASVNRARAAFERDPAEDRAVYPDAIDPTTTLLRLDRDGVLAGAINWFAVHNTSMPNTNRLISADNKGWAAFAWEQDGADPQGVDAELVTAFAQTNAGDLSPNLDLLPGRGPTDDERENTRIIGDRQLAAARALAAEEGEELGAGIEVRHRYFRMAGQRTTNGRTGRGILGASFAAGKMTDGPGSPLFREGKRNPVPEWISRRLYDRYPALAQAQEPKDMFLPVGQLRWVQETFLLQLVRLGRLHLVCVPFEVTIVAALRLRRAVAAELGVDLADVLLQGYANGYGHYVTTPEEYDEQLYEGGATIFGRDELGVVTDAVVDLARALRKGEPIERGDAPSPYRLRLHSLAGAPRLARNVAVTCLSVPESARSGETVTASFGTGHPNAEIPATYFRVERHDDAGWVPVAGDADLSTTLVWQRDWSLRFRADITWVAGAPGEHRITWLAGAAVSTPSFQVT